MMNRSTPIGRSVTSSGTPTQRRESGLERLDRNWADLLQELRVVQTGVQLLTGFLLTLPFQARFAALGEFQQNVYLLPSASPSQPPVS